MLHGKVTYSQNDPSVCTFFTSLAAEILCRTMMSTIIVVSTMTTATIGKNRFHQRKPTAFAGGNEMRRLFVNAIAANMTAARTCQLPTRSQSPIPAACHIKSPCTGCPVSRLILICRASAASVRYTLISAVRTSGQPDRHPIRPSSKSRHSGIRPRSTNT